MFRGLAALRSFSRAWLFRSRMERDMDREMRFHVDERIADLEAGGMPRDEAQRHARDECGDVVRWKEAGREARGLRVIDELGTDLRYGLRTMWRSPGFTGAAVVTLALGIGATTAIFSIVYGVLMRPLPYPAADRLVRLWQEHPGGVEPAGNRWLSNHTYAAWVTDPRTLEGIGAYATYEYTVRLGDEPVRVVGAAVSPSVFALLKAMPQAGRFFEGNEGGAGGDKVVVLSDQLWRDRLGAAPTLSVASSRLTINYTRLLASRDPVFVSRTSAVACG
jgi:putative ABC transport system permease protein